MICTLCLCWVITCLIPLTTPLWSLGIKPTNDRRLLLNSSSRTLMSHGVLDVKWTQPAWNNTTNTGPEVIKLFPCLTGLSRKFILLINVKMPTIVGILTFISMTNTTSERLKARNFFICRYFSFYEQLKFPAQLSWAWKKFHILRSRPLVKNA